MRRYWICIVDHPDQVVHDQKEDGEKIIFKLQVAKDDVGKVIGRGSQNANALRTLMRGVAEKEGKRAGLEIAD